MIRTFLCFAFLFALAATGAAQQPTPEKPELPTIKDQIIVTATRGELTQEQSPNATGVVTLQENRIRNVQTLDQSLNQLEGVFAFRAKGLMDNEARIMMRGFGGQNRTLILLDGQPINDGYTGNVLWTMLPVNEVERVEVARGPFSSLYGGNAMGGVVNILTRPVEQRSFEASAQYGTWNTTNYSGRYSDRFFNRLGLTIGYQRLQTNGYAVRPITATATTTGTGGTTVTGLIPSLTLTGARTFIIGAGGNNWHNQHAVRLKSEFALTSNTQISGQYIRQNSGYGYDNYTSFVRDAAGNAIDRGPVLFNDNGTVRRFNFTPGSFLQIPGHAISHFVSGNLLHKFNAQTFLQLSAGTNYQPDVQFRSPGVATATQAGGPGVASDRASRNNYFNAQFNWNPAQLKTHSFVFGAETRQDFSNALEFNLTNWQVKQSVSNQIYEALGRTFNQAVYAQDQIRLRENITIVAGLRYDYWRTYDGFFNGFTAATPLTKYDARSNDALTGKVAAAWQLGKGFTLRSSVGTAFRNPTVLDMYRSFRLSSGTLFLGNPALKPERLFSYEFGARQQIGNRTTLEATYFRNQITDLIYRKTDLAADPTGNIRLNVNAGEGTTNGVEFSARQQLTKWLQFRASYTYVNPIISQNPFAPATVGKRIPFLPQHTAAASLLGAWRRLTGSLNARYVGASFSTDTNTDTTRGVFGAYDPFFVMDASFGVELGRGLTVFLSADNWLDRRYYQFFQSPGSSVNVGMRWRK